MPTTIILCPNPFIAWEKLASFEETNIKHNKYGANAVFVGKMRDFNKNQSVTSMQLEYYPGMTEQELYRLATESKEKYLECEVAGFKGLDENRENAKNLKSKISDEINTADTIAPEPTILICHRVGDILPSDDIVIVGVWTAHRAQAFDLCREIMEDLKSKAPFWKKEVNDDGETYWVDP